MGRDDTGDDKILCSMADARRAFPGLELEKTTVDRAVE